MDKNEKKIPQVLKEGFSDLRDRIARRIPSMGKDMGKDGDGYPGKKQIENLKENLQKIRSMDWKELLSDREQIKDVLLRLLVPFLLVVLMLFLLFHNKEVHDSSYTRKAERNYYSLGMDNLNTTLTEKYALEDGDKIFVNIVHVGGGLSIQIGIPGEEPVYAGNGGSVDRFLVNIHETGDYEFTVTGENAEGSISFRIDRYSDLLEKLKEAEEMEQALSEDSEEP